MAKKYLSKKISREISPDRLAKVVAYYINIIILLRVVVTMTI